MRFLGLTLGDRAPDAKTIWLFRERLVRAGAIEGLFRQFEAVIREAGFVNELRSMKVRPHVAQNTNGRRSAIDGRTTRHASYAASQRTRKRIEEGFGWIKTVAGMRQTRLRGRDKVGWAFTFAAAAYNLVRLPKLLDEVAA